MNRHRPANAAVTFPALLSVALLSLLALSGCVAPPATLYGSQPAQPGYQTQYYTPAPEPAQSPPPRPYETQPYQQPAPQQSYAPQYSATYCAAGAYQCPVPPATPVGTSCACSGLGAASYGVAQ